ncbi:hypothetical protein S83_071457 [Arachis hypogaea]|nr:Dynamin-related protein 4C [Arachis hypogaea]
MLLFSSILNSRNRIGDESYEEARIEEERLFESHPMLSKIDKSIVGVPVLAQRLVQVQGMIISKTLPEIVKKINEKLTYNLSELDKLPVNLTCVADAMTAFMHIIGLSKESLRKILLRREFDEYPDEKNMHCTARFRNKRLYNSWKCVECQSHTQWWSESYFFEA